MYSVTVADSDGKVVASRRKRVSVIETFVDYGTGCGGRVPCVYVTTEDLAPGKDDDCVSPGYLVYRSPGCDGTIQPVCTPPETIDGDGGLTEACGCDGASVYGAGSFVRPYRHLGECGGVDAGRD